jgi:hypothetical protein
VEEMEIEGEGSWVRKGNKKFMQEQQALLFGAGANSLM